MIARFVLDLALVKSDLERLTGMSFRLGHPDILTPLGVSIFTAGRYHRSQQWLFRDFEYQQLLMVSQSLSVIEKHDPILLDQFRLDLRRRRSLAQYYGIREEISVATFLINNGISFVKGESPDFRVEFDGAQIPIECSSCHVATTKMNNLYRKIEQKIAEKGRKVYASPAGIISIDATNIYFHMANGGTPIHRDRLHEVASAAVNATPWEAVMITAGVFNEDKGLYIIGFSRSDAEHIDPITKRFLDTYCQTGLYFMFAYRTKSHS